MILRAIDGKKTWNKCDKIFNGSWETNPENKNIISIPVTLYGSNSNVMPGTFSCLTNKNGDIYRGCATFWLNPGPEKLHVFKSEIRVNHDATSYKEKYADIIDLFVNLGLCEPDVKKKDLLKIYSEQFPDENIEETYFGFSFSQQYARFIEYFNILDHFPELDWENMTDEDEKAIEAALRKEMKRRGFKLDNKDLVLPLKERFEYQLPFLGLTKQSEITEKQLIEKLSSIDLKPGDPISIRFDFKSNLLRNENETDEDYCFRVFEDMRNTKKFDLLASGDSDFLNKNINKYFNTFTLKDETFVSAPTPLGIKIINLLNDNPKFINLFNDTQAATAFIEESKVLISALSMDSGFCVECLDEEFGYFAKCDEKGLLSSFELSPCDAFPQIEKDGKKVNKEFKSDIQNIFQAFMTVKNKLLGKQCDKLPDEKDVGKMVLDLLSNKDFLLDENGEPKKLTDIEYSVLNCFVDRNKKLNEKYNKEYYYDSNHSAKNFKIYEIPSLLEVTSYYIERRISKSYSSWIKNNIKNLSAEKRMSIQTAMRSHTRDDAFFENLYDVLYDNKDSATASLFAEGENPDFEKEKEILNENNKISNLGDINELSDETVVDLNNNKNKKDNNKSVDNKKTNEVKEAQKSPAKKETSQEIKYTPITVGKWFVGNRPSVKKNSPKYVDFNSQREYFEKEYIKAYTEGDAERLGKCRKCIAQCFRFYSKPFDADKANKYFKNLVDGVEPGKIKKQSPKPKEKPQKDKKISLEETGISALAKQILDDYIGILNDKNQPETKYGTLQKLATLYKIAAERNIEDDIKILSKDISDTPSGRGDD